MQVMFYITPTVRRFLNKNFSGHTKRCDPIFYSIILIKNSSVYPFQVAVT